MARKAKKAAERRGPTDGAGIDDSEESGSGGFDDSDVPESERAIGQQQGEGSIEKDEGDIYDKEEREGQMEEDEISSGEAGFVEGYEDTEVVECGKCGGKLDFEKAVERVINGKTYIFCSKKCAESFENRKAGLR
jgi:hypothetical protein